MRNNRGKDGQKSFFSRFVFVFAVVIILILFLGIAREYMKRVELDREVAELDQELEKLKLKKKDFLNSIEAYQSNFFLEQEAREKFNLKLPGEKVTVIPTALSGAGSDSSGLADAAAGENGDQPSLALKNVLAWWQYFFNSEEKPS